MIFVKISRLPVISSFIAIILVLMFEANIYLFFKMFLDSSQPCLSTCSLTDDRRRAWGRRGGSGWRVTGESSKVKLLLSLCKGVELDRASLFPLPRVLFKLSPGFLPSQTSPLLPLQPQPSPRSLSSARIR